MGQGASTIEHTDEKIPVLYHYNHSEDLKDEESVCNITDYLIEKGLLTEESNTDKQRTTVTRQRREPVEAKKRKDDSMMSDAYYKALTYLPPRQAIRLGTPSPRPIDRQDPDYLDLGFERAVEEANRIRERTFPIAPIPALLNEFVDEHPAGSFRRTIEQDAANCRKDISKISAQSPRRSNQIETINDITQRQHENFEQTPANAIDSNRVTGSMEYQNEGSQDYLFSIGNAAARLRGKSITPPAPVAPEMHPSMYQMHPEAVHPYYPGYPPYAGHYPYPPHPDTIYDPAYPGASSMVYRDQNNNIQEPTTSHVADRQLPPTETIPKAANPALTQYDVVHTSPSTQHIQHDNFPITPKPQIVDRKTPPTISSKAVNPQQTQYDTVYVTSPKLRSPQVPARTASRIISPKVPAQTQYEHVYEPGTTPPPKVRVSPKTEGNSNLERANRGATQYEPVHEDTYPENYGSPGYPVPLPATPISVKRSMIKMEITPRVSPRQTQYDPVTREDEEFDAPADEDTIIEIKAISPRGRPQATQYDSVSEEVAPSRALARPNLNKAIKLEICDHVDASFDTELDRSCTIPDAVSSCGSQMNGSGVFDTVAEEPVVDLFKKPLIKTPKQKTIRNYFLPPVPRVPRRISSLSTASVPLINLDAPRVHPAGAKQVPVQKMPLQPKRSQAVLQERDKNLEHQKRRKTMPATSTPLPNAVPFTVPDSLDTLAPTPTPLCSPPTAREKPNADELRKKNKRAYIEILAKQIQSQQWTIETVTDVWKEACRNVEQRRHQYASHYAAQQYAHYFALHNRLPLAQPHRDQKFARYSYPGSSHIRH